jgi:hypothetical protein
VSRPYTPREVERGNGRPASSGGSHMAEYAERQRILANLSPAERAQWRKLFKEAAPGVARNAKGEAAA